MTLTTFLILAAAGWLLAGLGVIVFIHGCDDRPRGNR